VCISRALETREPLNLILSMWNVCGASELYPIKKCHLNYVKSVLIFLEKIFAEVFPIKYIISLNYECGMIYLPCGWRDTRYVMQRPIKSLLKLPNEQFRRV
jgi:hypothetical protein